MPGRGGLLILCRLDYGWKGKQAISEEAYASTFKLLVWSHDGHTIMESLPSANCCRTCLLHRRFSSAVRTSRVRGNMSRESDTAAQMLLLGAKSS